MILAEARPLGISQQKQQNGSSLPRAEEKVVKKLKYACLNAIH